jgi:hypothetical protein
MEIILSVSRWSKGDPMLPSRAMTMVLTLAELGVAAD